MASITVTVRRPSWWPQLGLWRRLRAARTQITSALLTVAGLAGALGGGWLIGQWCLGLVLIVESAGAVWLGLMREDGVGLPRRGERTVAQVLEEARRMP